MIRDLQSGIRPLVLVWVMVGYTYVAASGADDWVLPTPGGHVICVSDPYQANHGCCLRSGESSRGAATGQGERVFASHLRQWKYYKGYVVGVTPYGYFIFNESHSRIDFFESKQAMQDEIEARQLGEPTSLWYSPRSGGDLTLGWPNTMRKAAGASLRALIADMPDDDRARLAQKHGVVPDQLARRLLAQVEQRYEPIFHFDEDVSPLIIAGQYDEAAALRSIVRAAHQIDPHAIRDESPLVAVLAYSAQQGLFEGERPVDLHDALVRRVNIHFTDRILQEHLHPTPRGRGRSPVVNQEQAVNSARTSSLIALLYAIRSQLELAQIQHQGRYPDLITQGWRPLLGMTGDGPDYPPGDRFGPYLSQLPRNPWASREVDPTSIAVDTRSAWQYNPSTGQLKAVVAMTNDQYVRWNMHPRDCIRVDRPGPLPDAPPRARELRLAVERAKAAALMSQLQKIRSMLELGQIQHAGYYPDLVTRGWTPMTVKTGYSPDYAPGNDCGPYLQHTPRNPFAPRGQSPSSVSGDASAAWQYDQRTGRIKAVVVMRPSLYQRLGLDPEDTVRRNP